MTDAHQSPSSKVILPSILQYFNPIFSLQCPLTAIQINSLDDKIRHDFFYKIDTNTMLD